MKSTHYLIFLLFCLSQISCREEDRTNLNIPATYTFERDGQTTVNYSGQTQRLDMLTELDSYLKTTQSLGTVVDAEVMKNMFANENSPFTSVYAKKLKDKCYEADQAFFEQWLEEAAVASAKNVNAQPGIAGHLNEEYPEAGTASSAGYLVNENGIEYQQIIVKGLMGAVFYFQANERYLTEERMDVLGNDDLSEGSNYTNMEHYFDEAFGYFGIAPDFGLAQDIDAANKVRFWGKYCLERDLDETDQFGYQGITKTIMDAFKKGRAAIVAKDYTARDEAIQIIQDNWEIVVAATAANYLERSLSDKGAATYKRHHYLSEAIAFMMALKYKFDGGQSKTTRLSNTSIITQALNIIGVNTNLYEITDTEINATIDKIIAAFPTGTIR